MGTLVVEYNSALTQINALGSLSAAGGGLIVQVRLSVSPPTVRVISFVCLPCDISVQCNAGQGCGVQTALGVRCAIRYVFPLCLLCGAHVLRASCLPASNPKLSCSYTKAVFDSLGIKDNTNAVSTSQLLLLNPRVGCVCAQVVSTAVSGACDDMDTTPFTCPCTSFSYCFGTVRGLISLPVNVRRRAWLLRYASLLQPRALCRLASPRWRLLRA